MATLTDLHRTVQTTLAANKVGVPVFVRYLLSTQEKGPALIDRLGFTLATVRLWLNQPFDRVYALGAPQDGRLQLMIECKTGATAMISWSNSQSPGLGVDLMVIGNHGAIYHDAGAAMLWDEPIGPVPGKSPEFMTALVSRALRSGKPEDAGE